MPRNTVFIMTHLASGWEKLVDKLNKHPRIEVFNTGRSYFGPDDVKQLTLQPHKQGGAAAVWGDLILHNKDFCMKYLCQHYKLIFWARPWNDELHAELMEKHGYGEQQAIDYYSVRLSGIQEYWHRKYNRGTPAPWNPDLKGDTLLSSIL